MSANFFFRASVGASACASLTAALRLRQQRWELQAQTGTSHGTGKASVGLTQTTQGTCVIVGSGIVGLTTAYYLTRTNKYDKIHVIDQHEDCSQGGSFQNGGVINVEAIAPVNSYMDIFAALKNSILYHLTGADTNTVVTWRAMIEPPGLMLWWLWYFFKNKDEESIQRNSRKMMELGNATGPLFKELIQDLNLNAQSHNFTQTPGLVLFHADDPEAVIAKKQERFGAVKKKHYVTGKELEDIQKRSGLLGLERQGYNVGCVEPDNLTVNTRTLSKSLRSYMESRGVQFHYLSEVENIVIEGSRASGIMLATGESIKADSVVLCAGYETCYMLRKLGITVPLSPCKAYSLHIRNASVAPRLKYAAHLESNTACLVTPYRDSTPTSVRVTGVRDMDGFNTIVREDRLAALMKSARTFVGDDFDEERDVSAWAGVMPVSPDDFPIVGGLQKYENIYVNAGHGFRGTNWSVATAKLLSQVMVGDSETCIGRHIASPSRFGV